MGLLDIFRPAWNIEATDAPWDPSRVSIFQHIASHAREDGLGLQDGGETLPDEVPTNDTQIRWAAGALDGVGTHHGGWAGGSEKSEQVGVWRAGFVPNPTANIQFPNLDSGG